MSIIVIYPGRFQPFGRHHYETYKWIVSKFGIDNVYISTSNSVDDKSPLDFEEKSKIIRKYGISKDKIVQASKPYMPTNHLNRFDKNVDKLIVVYGEKDYGRIGFSKKDGSSSYFKKYIGQRELDSFKDSAYVIVAPHVSINHNGSEICGTYLREVLADCTRKDMFDLMGWSDENIYSIFRRKFQPIKNVTFVKEVYNTIQESNITKTQLQRLEQYVDALFFRFGIDVDFKAMLNDSHFYQRLNDPRNKPEIAADEIRQLFKKVSKEYGDILSKLNTGAEGVLRDMSSDINIPFIIKWDRDKREIDLVPKTIMRKKDFKSADTIFKVEHFKGILESNTSNKGKYIRHIQHPYETDMSFSDLKRLLSDVINKVEVIENCTVKLDGWNFQMTYIDGVFACSRNKATILSPMSLEQLSDKYVNKPNIRNIFCEAFTTIEIALSASNQDALKDAFSNGRTFINFEILHDKPLNILKNANNSLSIHGMITYDEMGNELYRSNVLPKVVEKCINKVYNGISINKTPEIELKPTIGANIFIDRLSILQHKYKIPESSKISTLPDSIISEIRLIVFQIGNAVIKANCSNTDTMGNVNRIISIIDEVGYEVRSDADIIAYENCCQILDKVGGLSSINSIEGIVFQWNGYMLKLTGTFGVLVPVFSIWNKMRF